MKYDKNTDRQANVLLLMERVKTKHNMHSDTELGNVLGVSRNVIWRWRKQPATMKIGTIWTLADMADLSDDDRRALL